jgi:hypothetical protein
MKVSLHIAPVGLGPVYKLMNYSDKGMNSWPGSKGFFVIGPSPIPPLTCPDTPELGLPSTHSLSYGFQSRPAFSRICPASVFGIRVQYAG